MKGVFHMSNVHSQSLDFFMGALSPKGGFRGYFSHLKPATGFMALSYQGRPRLWQIHSYGKIGRKISSTRGAYSLFL